MGLEKNRGVFKTKTIRRVDLRYAVSEAAKLSGEASRIGMSPEYHRRAGKAWDRVAFLTKEDPEEKQMHDDATENARLEYARMEEIQKERG